VEAYSKYGGVISGALACYGQKRMDQGIHICKFDPWLPSGSVRQVSVAASANMLCERATFESVGGFDDNYMIGDTLLSWNLTRAGVPIWLAPEAVVEHHHTGTWKGLLQERYLRGCEFGQMRLAHEGVGKRAGSSPGDSQHLSAAAYQSHLARRNQCPSGRMPGRLFEYKPHCDQRTGSLACG